MQIAHAGMGDVVGAEHGSASRALSGCQIDCTSTDREDDLLGVAQGDALAGARSLAGEIRAHIERDRDRPERAVGQPHLVDDAVIVGLVEEALQRGEAAIQQQFQIAKLAGGSDPRTAVRPPRPSAWRRCRRKQTAPGSEQDSTRSSVNLNTESTPPGVSSVAPAGQSDRSPFTRISRGGAAKAQSPDICLMNAGSGVRWLCRPARNGAGAGLRGAARKS